LDRFCRVFPDAFYVPERVLIFLKEDKDSRGRLLSAGFHLMTGYFRDDAPLSELILDEQAKHERAGHHVPRIETVGVTGIQCPAEAHENRVREAGQQQNTACRDGFPGVLASERPHNGT